MFRRLATVVSLAAAATTLTGCIQLAAFGLLATVHSGACGRSSEPMLELSVTDAYVTTPRWGETMECRGRQLVASYRTPTEQPTRVLSAFVLEVYRGDDRLDVPRTRAVIDNIRSQGCGFTHQITYDLSGLEEGTYTVVHRRRYGIRSHLECLDECPWGEFQGDEALVMTLVLHAPPQSPAP